ncbi:MAG: type II toxin-antitoxin system HicA family toxin [Pseudodesulfovibrio sp.]|uniref:type II toxin-antitoxin system HicA family toxin n=1 Tax=Pseudodesulfovibrio sp. TaxID=2035812 RepID=UPI003D0D84FC
MNWPAVKGGRVLKALLKAGWYVRSNHGGSHKTLARSGSPSYTWSFGDDEEIGPRMLARIAKHTGLTPKDL